MNVLADPCFGSRGLQHHDPGDVVWFKEIMVRPLPDSLVKVRQP